MPNFQGKVHRGRGGDVLTVASGGAIDVESGGAIQAGGTQASNIATVSSTDSGSGGDDATFVTAINAIIAVLEGAGLAAGS